MIVLLLFAMHVRADIGNTHELKRQRELLMLKMDALQSSKTDSASGALYAEMAQQIIELDDQIFDSYEQTVDRMAAKKINQTSNNRLLVMLAMITTAIALFLSFLIMMARNRVVEKDNSGLMGVYRQLSADLMRQVSPEKGGNIKLLRVNIVVILGLLMMGASIIAFLIGTI